MPDPDQDAFAAEAAKMTDEELIDTWQTASEEETENLPPLLKAVVDEMGKLGVFGLTIPEKSAKKGRPRMRS